MSCHKTSLSVVIVHVEGAEEFVWDRAAAGFGEEKRAAGIEALFREHYPRIVRMLARLVGDRGQAEEIASDAFSKLARRRAVDAPEPWLYRVAMNAGVDALRANARRRRHEQAADAEARRTASAAGPLEELLRAERCARVRAVLGGLKPRDAGLLLLKSSGLAYREIALALGLEAGSVGTMLARAERQFERKYRARFGDDV